MAGVKLKPSMTRRPYASSSPAIAERDLDHVGQAVMLDLGLAVDELSGSQSVLDQPLQKMAAPITPRSRGFTGRERLCIA